MSDSTKNPSPPKLSGLQGVGVNWGMVCSVGVTLLMVTWFYGYVTRFGFQNAFSALGWLYGNWQAEADLEHGKFVPFLALGLIAYRIREIRQVVTEGSWWGIAAVVFGCLCFVAAYRTIQPRIAIVGFPFILCGMAYALYGWRVTKMVAFPLFLIWGVVPLPSFQQATVHLQLLATQMAHHGSSLFGVETYIKGTVVLPIEGDWKPLSIAHGCSGIRSLMALFMITAIWAYIAKIALWKKTVLFLSAIPLAIIGNSLRIISIFVIAEHGNADWAINTWHDWSGLLFFYPISLMLLLVVHSVLEGGLPWRRNKKKVIRRIIQQGETKEEEP
jgi:exosortase